MTSAVGDGVGSAVVVLQANATGPLDDTAESIVTGVPEWFADALFAVLVLVSAYFLSQFLVGLLARRLARRLRRPSLTRVATNGIRLGVLLVATFTILGIFGLELGDIALSVTVFSAVVGVVLAPIVGNVISGLFLLADQPYEIGDMIELADSGQRGFVEEITLRYTKVFTLDNTFLVLPNGSMRERDVVNYSAEDSRTRQSLQLLVTYEGDLEAARKIMEDSAREVESVVSGGPDIRIGAARYPAGPTCYIEDFSDHGVLLTLRYWVEQPYKLLTVKSAVQENVWARLDDADVDIAYPHSHLVFDETSGDLSVSMDGRPPGQDRHLDEFE